MHAYLRGYFVECVYQALCDFAGLAVAYYALVELYKRNELGGCSGKEALVGSPDVEARNRFFVKIYVERLGELYDSSEPQLIGGVISLLSKTINTLSPLHSETYPSLLSNRHSSYPELWASIFARILLR